MEGKQKVIFPTCEQPEAIIRKYYERQPQLMEILLKHSRQVADRALQICDCHPELNLDRNFLYEAAMLHDIGIIHTNAPLIHCMGTERYVCHGQIGGEMLRQEGLPRHARVAERHTGAGLPGFLPETLEEQVICYADKFYSKTHLDEEKTFEAALRHLQKYGEEGANRFCRWHKMFG